jgi:hypothetical protein
VVLSSTAGTHPYFNAGAYTNADAGSCVGAGIGLSISPTL